MGYAGLDETALASQVEVHPKTVSRYLDRQDPPKRSSNITALANALGVSRLWLETGRGQMLSEVSPPSPALPAETEGDSTSDLTGADTETVRVPEYGEVGAGPGRVPLEVVSYREITVREFVVDFGQRPPPSGIVTGRGYFTVVGDSAAPIYFDRERVPVEELPDPTQRFRQDTVYVFRWEGDLMLKRLRKLEGGRIRAYSLNPSIEPFHFRPEGEHDFAVVAIAREPQKQQLYAVLVGRFLRFESRPLRPEDLA